MKSKVILLGFCDHKITRGFSFSRIYMESRGWQRGVFPRVNDVNCWDGSCRKREGVSRSAAAEVRKHLTVMSWEVRSSQRYVSFHLTSACCEKKLTVHPSTSRDALNIVTRWLRVCLVTGRLMHCGIHNQQIIYFWFMCSNSFTINFCEPSWLMSFWSHRNFKHILESLRLRWI